MRLTAIDSLPSHTITQFGSRHAAISGLARGEAPFHLAVVQLEAGGILGLHPATTSQLLLVIAGEGWVSGGDGVKRHVHQGIAVLWDGGETHETTTDTGLSAVVFESDNLNLPSVPGNSVGTR